MEKLKWSWFSFLLDLHTLYIIKGKCSWEERLAKTIHSKFIWEKKSKLRSQIQICIIYSTFGFLMYPLFSLSAQMWESRYMEDEEYSSLTLPSSIGSKFSLLGEVFILKHMKLQQFSANRIQKPVVTIVFIIYPSSTGSVLAVYSRCALTWVSFYITKTHKFSYTHLMKMGNAPSISTIPVKSM